MIRTKENRKYLKNFKGCYAYSYVDEYGDPVDLNIVVDTYLDDDGFVNGVTYCKIPPPIVMVNLALLILFVMFSMNIANIVVT